MDDLAITKKMYLRQLKDGWKLNQNYVFVSYASRDWEKVYPTVLALRALGINVYIDVEFIENQSSSWLENFQERLFRGGGCKGIVAFLSINYMRSYACLMEQLANRTDTMRQRMGKPLPVFYIALEPRMGTLQQMSAYIYEDAVMEVSTREQVQMSPPESAVLQRFVRDCNYPKYPDAESVTNMLDGIRDKHDVATTMYRLIFEEPLDMPSIQVFEEPGQCAKQLADNFINDKNWSIKLYPSEALRQETLRRMEDAVPGSLRLSEDSSDGAVLTGIQEVSHKAEKNDPDEENRQGLRYLKGDHVRKDDEQAVCLFYKAARQGHGEAANNLGLCYANGWGVEADPVQAANWFLKSAETGYAKAQNNLGLCYENGQGIGQDYRQAVYWYEKAARQGYANAQCNLGFCYECGQGTEQDDAQAALWYEKAARQGYAQAQNNLALCYDTGRGVAQDFIKAADWFLEAARQGYSWAQNNLALYYKNGRGVRQDEAEAVRWFLKAAAQGHMQAQYHLGLCCEYGQGTDKDPVQAVVWYRKSAERGYAHAQYRLGECYKKGQGVKKDYAQAADWFQKAALSDCKEAQEAFADCYEKGLGVPRNLERAVYWRNKARGL